MIEMTGKELFKLAGAATKRPDNRITLKVSGLVLNCQEYTGQDGKVMRQYQIWSKELGGAALKFGTSRLLKVGESAEIMLTLVGFNAFEAGK